MTNADLIAKHNELEDLLAAEMKAYKEWAAPYQQAMEVIQGELRTRLLAETKPNPTPWLETSKASFATENGTAYLTTVMSVKVDNPEAFRQLVTQDWSFADLRCRKEPVDEWLGKHNGQPPPGVAIAFNTKCNIRRS